MVQLTDQQVVQYLHRSYAAVDGLWFVKVEQALGFDAALDLDEQVWGVLPKIQARSLKSLTGLTTGLDHLAHCLAAKLTVDGFTFTTDLDTTGGNLTITIDKCPWHELMIKAGRTALSGKVGTRICTAEYSVWAAEFGPGIAFHLGSQICRGDPCCTLNFTYNDANPR